MAFSHVITQAVAAGSESISKQKTYSAAAMAEVSESIPDTSVDLQIVFTLDVSAVKSFYMVSDKAITIETNSGGVPANTLVLKAGVPYLFNSDSYDTFKFTTDITALFVTNASGSAAQLEIKAITDPTP